jgi:hypothetical protein
VQDARLAAQHLRIVEHDARIAELERQMACLLRRLLRGCALRRCKTLTLAAEIQWELPPPLTFGIDRVVITGGLEPAYDIGGDTFDYAVNAATADLLILVAVGWPRWRRGSRCS